MAAKKSASTSVPEAPAHKLSIIVSKGSLDMAYPPFILGNAAAIMGYEVHLFFTFWGMDVITKKRYGRLKATPVGNPGAHMPNLAGILPGATPMMTAMLRSKIKKLKIAPIPEMVANAKDLGVHLHACSTSMEMLGLKPADFISEVEDVVGAASFLGMSEGGQIIFI